MAALRPLPLALAASTLAACIGSTGGDLVTFPATVHGPAREGAVPRADGDHRADPLVFTTASGWTVTLTLERRPTLNQKPEAVPRPRFGPSSGEL